MSTSEDRPTDQDDWGDDDSPWARQPAPPPSPPPSPSPGPVGSPSPQPVPPRPAPTPSGVTPPNYLVPSIAATVLCCLPAGVVGIVYANQVNAKAAVGDLAGAVEASAKAKLWTLVSVVLALTGWTLYVLVYAVSV